MIKRFIIKMIKAYQRMPLSTHANCKYIPTCSEYAIKSLEKHGLIKGMFYSIVRVLKCNPFSKGGIDPVK